MTETVDWAPFDNDGEVYRAMAPKGLSFSLATDDIRGAQPTPIIRTLLHPENADKNFPDTWLPPEFYDRKRPTRRLITDRSVNPLSPEYKIPQGDNRLPAGDMIFSNRITDLMDTSDILGARPRILYKGPVRVRIEDIVFDRKAHPARRFFERLRCPVGTGLDLYDINIGKRTFGFERYPRSNPVEPIYSHELQETDEEKFKRLKKKMIAPRKRFWDRGDPIIDRVMRKLYWKPMKLADSCKRYDVDLTDRVSYEELRASLEEFDIRFTDEEFNQLIPYADQEGAGSVKYLKLSKALRWPSGLQVKPPKRIGEEQWEGIYGNLGQGVQVLVESGGRGKKMNKEAEDKYRLVDTLSGDPLVKDGIVAVPPREMLCLSYGEQLGRDAHTKRDLNFKAFLPEPPSALRIRRTPVECSVQHAEPAADPDGAPPEKRRSFMGSPPRKPSITTEAAAAAAAPAPPPEGPPLVDGATVGVEEPRDAKLSVLAKKSTAPPGGYDGMPTFETMSRQVRVKRLSPPTFKKRIRNEQRTADVESVAYLG